jgi:type VI secretion system protein ImpK
MNERKTTLMEESTLAPEPAAKAWDLPPDSAQTAFVKDTAPQTLPMPPGPNHEERLERLRVVQAAGRNVLLEASAELLRTLAEVPARMNAHQVLEWRKLLREELLNFTRLCEQMSVRREHMLAVRYVLCTALDEAASLAPWNMQGAGEGTGRWSEMGLLPEFHAEREGGEVVFMLVGRMAHAPLEHMPVLEVIHQVLSLGFKGNYRVQTDGHRQFESIRHRLFSLISNGREPVPRELSAQWKGAGKGKFKLLRAVPVWASACVLGLVLIGQFAWAKYHLLTTSGELERRLHALRQLQPPQSVAPPLGLAKLLQAEIEARKVTVDEGPTRTLVVFKGDGMFASGQAQLAPASRAAIEKVGQALKSVAGQAQVWGHTDNLPNPDPQGLNQRLSMERAQAVAAVLTAQGVAAERVKSGGKGAEAPLASNDTAEGRAQNRRVEIEVLPAPR